MSPYECDLGRSEGKDENKRCEGREDGSGCSEAMNPVELRAPHMIDERHCSWAAKSRPDQTCIIFVLVRSRSVVHGNKTVRASVRK